ncbi:MAG: response regulator [Bdellovibrionales bacterium]|nr:response regulator [Bdellovibrionales bacterium]
MRALVVEDDFASRKIVQKILGHFFECDVAVNGEEALAAFDDAHSSQTPYTLICLDVMMPNMDGHEVLKQVREKEEALDVGGLAGVKVIMTTGRDDKESILSAFREGCEAYLTKPINREDLLSKLHELGLITDIQLQSASKDS